MEISSSFAHHIRFRAPHAHLSAPFGSGTFGAFAEGIARFFGTPQYLISQTVIVILWIIWNGWVAVQMIEGSQPFDPYPFILLNLAFSLQAAYAAPLILLAQTRQADRDKVWSEAEAKHREELAECTLSLLQQNTTLTEQVAQLAQQVHDLTEEIHRTICGPAAAPEKLP